MDYLLILTHPGVEDKRVTVGRSKAQELLRFTLDRESKHKSSKVLVKKLMRTMDKGQVVSLKQPQGGRNSIGRASIRSGHAGSLVGRSQGGCALDGHGGVT